ncbi:MAG: nucleoprotein/polynucleotide-associated enzyme, partial [Gammaproteobacteria bacterium]|nr:nucleoprotein/polynucleotide-associated enzyme [Gammaproteobacteria bacterium]
QIEQIIEQNRVPRLETEDYYSFIDGKKIRRMSVDAQRREQLTRGELVIVRYRGHYAVVPPAIAERIRERDANMVVPLVQPKASTEPDDAYKDFVVPDDLMW